MDTIIYVYFNKTSTNTAYIRKDYDMRDYQLVRIGLSAQLLRILQEKTAELSEQENDISSPKSLITRKWEGHALWLRRRMGIEKRRRQQLLLEENAKRQDFLREVFIDCDHSYFVLEEPIPFLERWSFQGYLEEEWIWHMMQHADLPHFLILGQVYCIPRVLLHFARQLKSVKWVLPGRQFKESYQELVEDIYEEYGLAVEVRLLEEEADYRRLRPECKLPTVILDFCEEERIPMADIAKGSKWLDMISSDLKRRRIEERNTGIQYFSLKKEWKQPQKALYQLDTTNKNGYNT